MPFPLAHPAAVLPLRRWCPGALSFSALVVGSLSPDLGYLFGPLNVHEFSHRWLGIFGFCLPAGLLVMWLFCRFRSPAIAVLPRRCREELLPLCAQPPGPVSAVVLSLLIGAATHVFWDSFTHKEGWFVQHLAFLKVPLFPFAGRTVRVFHLFWYGCSFAGVALVCLAYDRSRRTNEKGPPSCRGTTKLGRAAVFATLVLLIGVVHHLVPKWPGYVLAACLTLLLVAGILLSAASPRGSAGCG